MTQSAHCETCGRATDDSSTGLCPNCLLRTAIDHGVTQAIIPSLPRLHYFGDYELLEEIARGGMGVVYRARQISLERTVAVKMMRPGLLATDAEIRRFHAEAKTAAGLQHPNIVAIHEVGEIDGLHYFSMDFVEGPSLADLVRERALPPAEAASYVKTLAETVQYAHSGGILHRDLKPSNVLIDAAGRPRITDFGLARPLNSDSTATVHGTVVGTPAYMPPEQAAGDHQRLGPASDVYSLGAILFELLTGCPPFRGATQVETVRMVIDEQPTPPRKLNAEVSRDLETVCLRCLEKDPSRRYASARELAADLDRVLRGDHVHRTIPGWKWAAAALAVILLIAIFGIVRTDRRAEIHVEAVRLPAVPEKAPPPSPAPEVLPPAPKAAKAAAKSAPPRLPAATSTVSPDEGAGYEQTFTFHYSVPEGSPKIRAVRIDFHEDGPNGPRDCDISIEPESRNVLLQFDPEHGPQLRRSSNIGSIVPLENSVCSVNLTDLGVEPRGAALGVRVPMTFKPTFDGPKEIRSWLTDDRGQVREESRITARWTVGPPQQ
jgi:predicted Ser/Thr protein kinase